MQTSAGGSAYVSGSDVVVTVPVSGDLIGAGGRVSVEQEVGADAAIAGGSVVVRAPVAEDLRVAGGSVSIESTVGGELVAAGGSVALRDSSRVAGSAWIAGNDVSIAGKLENGARVYANSVAISGKVDGDVQLYGRQLALMPGARINGDLSYASPNAIVRDPAAQVAGTITREPTPEEWESSRSGNVSLTVAKTGFHGFFVLAMLVVGMLLCLIFPATANGPPRAMRQHPGRSILFGLALLFTIPPLAVLFMVTVIGIPVGLALLLFYPFALLLGYLATAFLIGQQAALALKKPEPMGFLWQAFFLGLALVVLSLAAEIPFLGGLVMAAAVVTGMGGWAVWVQTAYSAARTR